jgi:hypothetical protein
MSVPLRSKTAQRLTALARSELGHPTAATAARIAATDTSGCDTIGSGAIDLETMAYSSGNRLEVTFIGAHH